MSETMRVWDRAEIKECEDAVDHYREALHRILNGEAPPGNRFPGEWNIPDMKPTYISPGTPIVVDGDRPATVRSSYPEGSTSYAFPHVRYDSADGEKNCAVSFSVELAGSGNGKVARVELDRHAADPWVGTRKGRPSAIRVPPGNRFPGGTNISGVKENAK